MTVGAMTEGGMRRPRFISMCYANYNSIILKTPWHDQVCQW
jgi:hypothetical protein